MTTAWKTNIFDYPPWGNLGGHRWGNFKWPSGHRRAVSDQLCIDPLETARVGRDASKIAEEVIAHLSGLIGADVTVTLEIQATVPTGAPDNEVRTVTENCRTLKFSDQGFERE